MSAFNFLKPFISKKEIQLQTLKLKYNAILSQPHIYGAEKVENLRIFVLPNLADPQIIPSISKTPRYLCSFPQCEVLNKSYSTKQKYIQHLRILHDNDLP